MHHSKNGLMPKAELHFLLTIILCKLVTGIPNPELHFLSGFVYATFQSAGVVKFEMEVEKWLQLRKCETY